MSKLSGKAVCATQGVDSDVGRVVGVSLRALREMAGLTQAEVAARLDVGQAAISKIESRGDVHISSLQKYVQALGAMLKIDAVLPSEFAVGISVVDTDCDQLVLPIFSSMSHLTRDVVLSVRPTYSEKIVRGEKTVELRRRFPVSAPRGTTAFIYSTSPVRAMIGSAEIDGVTKLPVRDIWKMYGEAARIDRQSFDTYFAGLDEGFALKFLRPRAFSRRIDLTELRDRFGFEPPQSFLYASPALRKALRDEFTNVSH